MKPTLITALLIVISTLCAAQTDTQVRSWQNLYEQLSDIDDMESGSLDDMYERLCELEDSPIDLNNATDDDLQQLTFLSEQQREDLTAYLYYYRPLRSMGEIAMIESMDPLRIQLLRHFTFIGSNDTEKQVFSLDKALKYGKNELVATTKIPFYERKGDRNGYLGYKYKHWFRYKFSYSQFLQAGITGAQDAGEPFFSNRNKLGYDHYSYYLLIRKLGRIKALALGQYKLKFGLGVVMNTGFRLGKTSMLALSPATNSITANSSRSDAYYLQGAATTVAVGRHTDLTVFASYRKIDATLNDDGDIRTILKTGYHRTPSEMQRKHNASQSATGGNLQWRNNGFHLGTTAIYTSFDKSLRPDDSHLFRRYYPHGKHFWNAGIDYGYICHRLNINGETAINNDNAIATLNSISYRFLPNLTATAIQRFYSYRYYSLFSSSFSDGGSIQNESGIYAGITWMPIARLSILAYTDYAYFPWAKYQISEASHSWDNLIQATYSIKRFTLLMRYRIRMRQKDAKDNGSTTESTHALISRNEQRGRLAIIFHDGNWTAKTQADIAHAASTDRSFGWMVSQTGGFKRNGLQATANINYFRTYDYDSRLYAYERGMLYDFSFPMFYGHGMRFSLCLQDALTKNFILTGKVGTTKYFDRDHIASSYQRIDGSAMTDLELQMKWKF